MSCGASCLLSSFQYSNLGLLPTPSFSHALVVFNHFVKCGGSSIKRQLIMASHQQGTRRPGTPWLQKISSRRSTHYKTLMQIHRKRYLCTSKYDVFNYRLDYSVGCLELLFVQGARQPVGILRHLATVNEPSFTYLLATIGTCKHITPK